MQSKIYFQCCLAVLFLFITSNTIFAQQKLRIFPTLSHTDQLSGQNGKKQIGADLHLLRINPDARTSGLGEAGLAVSPDASALYHNVSKLAFVEKKAEISLSHTQWMPQWFDNLAIVYFSAYKRIDEKQAIGASFRYFSMGEQVLFGMLGSQSSKPIQYAIDIGYSRKLSDKLSLGITLKHGVSDITRGMEIGSGNIVEKAKTFAVDLGVYHQNPNTTFLGKEATFSWGVAISNIGNKVKHYENQIKDFIPSNLGIGSAIDTKLGEKHQLMFTMDINKLLVPTPDPSDPQQKYRDKTAIGGILGSITDAPDGLKEELQELMFSLGMEYTYNRFLTLRLGHFNEHELKGNRKYLTTGLGVRYKSLEVNGAYLISTTSANTRLDKTLRLQLNVGFGKDG